MSRDYSRGASKCHGGSYTDAEDGIPENQPPKFVMTQKIKEMMKYGLPLTDAFPRRNRKLADTIRDSMLEMFRLSVRLEKKYHKKTTLEDLDIELAVLKEFIVLASDKDYCGDKFSPPLTIHQRDVWSKMNTEIGNIIGGYKKFVDSKTSENSAKPK